DPRLSPGTAPPRRAAPPALPRAGPERPRDGGGDPPYRQHGQTQPRRHRLPHHARELERYAAHPLRARWHGRQRRRRALPPAREPPSRGVGSRYCAPEGVYLLVQTTQSRIRVAEAARTRLYLGAERLEPDRRVVEARPGRIGEELRVEAVQGRTLRVEKV